jgi:hypothetical protein
LNRATRSWNRAGSRPRTTSRVGSRQPRCRLGTTVGAPLRPPVPRPLHRRSHPILPCHVPHAHGPRETDLRLQPTTSPPYASRAAPGRLLAYAPLHRLVHAAAHPCGGARDPLAKAHCLFKPSRLSSHEHPSPAAVAIAAAGEHLAPLAPMAS